MLEDLTPSTIEEDIPGYVHAYATPPSDKDHDQGGPFEPLSQFEDANTSDSIISRISDSGEPRLVLIDFEYCAYNYRGFDIANHFQEWGYDYTNPEHPFYFENQEDCPNLEQKVSKSWLAWISLELPLKIRLEWFCNSASEVMIVNRYNEDSMRSQLIQGLYMLKNQEAAAGLEKNP